MYFFKNVHLGVLRIAIQLKTMVSLVLRVVLRVITRCKHIFKGKMELYHNVLWLIVGHIAYPL